MTRADQRYRDGAIYQSKGQRIDRPKPGFFKMRYGRDRPWVAGSIHEIPPIDPDTGEMLDRPIVLGAEVDGREVPLEEAWISLLAHPISEDEYDHMRDVRRWALNYAPDEPEANIRDAVDLRKMAPILPPGIDL